jgi:hypothetical protein
LDAVPPDKLCRLVEEAIIGLIDFSAWQQLQKVEPADRKRIAEFEAMARRQGND